MQKSGLVFIRLQTYNNIFKVPNYLWGKVNIMGIYLLKGIAQLVSFCKVGVSLWCHCKDVCPKLLNKDDLVVNNWTFFFC